MLTTIGEACRAIKGELLAQLVDWIVDKLADDQMQTLFCSGTVGNVSPESQNRGYAILVTPCLF
jgi:hypothetical protein